MTFLKPRVYHRTDTWDLESDAILDLEKFQFLYTSNAIRLAVI